MRFICATPFSTAGLNTFKLNRRAKCYNNYLAWIESNSSFPTCTKASYKHRYAISLSLDFLAILLFPQLLRCKTDMVALQRCYAWVFTSSGCTQLLKALHKCYNTDVLGVLLIYPHSPSSAARPRESCMYISQTPCWCVTIYCCSCTIVHSKLLYHQLYLVDTHC